MRGFRGYPVTSAGRRAVAPLLVSLVLATVAIGADDKFRFDRLTIEDGLSQSSIQDMLQDRDGLIWVATRDGLNLYDGYEFQVFRHDPVNPTTTIAGNEIKWLYEDRRGSIWIALVDGGLSRFDKRTEQFTNFTHDPDDPTTIGPGPVLSMLEDSQGSFWVGTKTGLHRFNASVGTFVKFRFSGSQSEGDSTVVGSMLEDSMRRIWFGTNDGLKLYDIARNSFEETDLKLPGVDGDGVRKITSLAQDSTRTVWVGTVAGLFRLDSTGAVIEHLQNSHFNPLSISDDRIVSMMADNEGKLWVVTLSGLDIYHASFQGFVHYPNQPAVGTFGMLNHYTSIHKDDAGIVWLTTADGRLYTLDPGPGSFSRQYNDPFDPRSLSYDRVNTILEDRSGTVWLGTDGGGISKLSRKKHKFGLLEIDPMELQSLRQHQITAIVEELGGKIWIGTSETGAARYDTATHRLTWYQHDPGRATSLSDDAVTCMFVDRSGTLWIGTNAGGLNRKLPGGEFVRYRVGSPARGFGRSLRVTAIFEDAVGRIWAGTAEGLYSMPREAGGFRPFEAAEAPPGISLSGAVASISGDSAGAVWVAMSDGWIVSIGRNGKYVVAVTLDGGSRTPRTKLAGAVLANGGAGRLWIGTTANGLYSYDWPTGAIGHVTDREALASNRINGILRDDAGNLWLSTNEGLTRYHPETGEVRNFDFSAGLQSNEFNRGVCWKLQDGRMLFGGLNGVNVFHPAAVQDNNFLPPLVVTSFKVYDRTIPVWSGKGSPEVTISHNQSFFTIEFAALDYTLPEKNQYAYQMEGVDNGWVQSGNRRTVSYNKLDPGTYRFRFKGSNNDGLWNHAGGTLTIHITPPFWKTGWFQIAAVSVLTLLLVRAYRYKVASIRNQKRTLEDLVNNRTQELWEKTKQLKIARDQMEVRVEERTQELREANETLRKEIGDRIQVQGELTALKEFHENLVQTMTEGIVVQDLAGKISYMNVAATKLLGYSQQDLVGKHWSVIVPSGAQGIVDEADDRRRKGQVDHYELPMIRKDGTRVEVLVGGSPLYSHGNLTGSIAVFTDLTSLKTAQSRIREQAALIEKARDAIVVSDIAGNINYWNKSCEHVYGWKAEEAIGRDIHVLLHEQPAKTSTEAVRIILEKGEWAGELTQVARDGKHVIMQSRWTLLNDAEGFPRSIMMINTDITEKVRLEKQFLRAQRLESLGTLAGGIAHDLNNVLSPIIMALQVLKSKQQDEAEKTLLSTMEKSARRGADIVKQVLMFARGAEGKREELQIRHLIREMETIVRETFPKTIQLKTNISRDLWTLIGDPTQMHQVLLNLCVNARDAMPEGGTVNIVAENVRLEDFEMQLHPDKKSGSFVVVTVTDTGIGMTQDVMMKIFEPFFTTKGVGKGTGLGLSTVNGIVKGHGGFINVYSEIGRGSTFKIYLPAATGDAKVKEKEEEVMMPSGKGETILFIDDEPAIREIAKATLESYGYKVITAKDGLEGEDLYRQNAKKIVLVITDMMMPARGGKETIAVLRKLNPRLKIVVTSGLVGTEESNPQWQDQTEAFIMKPFTAEKLLRTLKDVLKNGRN